FKHSAVIATLGMFAGACSSPQEIAVTNPSDFDRTEEIVEIDTTLILGSRSGKEFKIVDSKGQEIPYQLTYDGKLIFPATVEKKATAVYKIVDGKPMPADSIVYGRYVPERKDDMAWENDRSAYRAYGPALQESGERAFGYDIWTKSVPHRILDRRYHDDIVNKVSFHEDHGNGMDVYAVGPTLGGGTAALLDNRGEIVYPYCYKDYKVLDNGPLRFTVKLVYGGETVDGDTAVIETRVISLDRSSYLNKTVISYDGLSNNKRVAPGIVVHSQNPEGYVLSPESGFMSYSDLTENADNNNGTIFVGVVSPDSESFEYKSLSEPAGDAIGHILDTRVYRNGDLFTYSWGSGWS
ncbi:MAG: DUF4861 domain-containing protein, partial [Muribaculaceae bacterium]|nr:DUF4861 domain-containing protein [Muribaculaceae bacterium]